MGATFDTGNMGMGALACSLVELFANMDPEARIGFFVGAKSRPSHAVRLAEQKELLFEVFRGLTGSPASLQGHATKPDRPQSHRCE
jgi:hypothetical protein